MSTAAWTLIFIGLCLTLDHTWAYAIARPNQGVLFARDNKLLLAGYQTLDYKFRLQLFSQGLCHTGPRVSVQVQKPASQFIISQAKALDDAIQAQRRICKILTVRVENTLKSVRKSHDLIPEGTLRPGTNENQNSSKLSRKKRDESYPVEFLGSLIHDISGLQDARGAHAMNAKIRQVRKFDAEEARAFDITDRLLANLTHHTYQVLQDQVKNQNQTDATLATLIDRVNFFGQNFSEEVRKLELTLRADLANAYLLQAGHLKLTSLLNVRHYLQELIDGLQVLISNKLPHQLVPSEAISDAISNMDRILKGHIEGLKVVRVPMAYFYEQEITFKVLENNTIHIVVPIPVSRISALYYLFKAHVLPIPLNPSNATGKGTSMLQDTAEYIAVSVTDMHYLQLTEIDLQLCEKGVVTSCGMPMPLLHPDRPTCLLAILLDLTKVSRHICKYSVDVLDVLPNRAYPLSHTNFLLSTQNQRSILSCPHVPPSTIFTPALSVATPPCGCSIRNGHLTLVNNNVTCTLDSKPNTIFLQTYNIPFLYHLNRLPDNITGITLHATPIIPPLEGYEKVRLSHLQEGLKFIKGAMSLDELAQGIKSSSPRPDSLADAFQTIDTGTSHPVYGLLTGVILVIEAVAILYIFCKLRTIAAVVLWQINRVNSMNITAWQTQLQAANPHWWQDEAERPVDPGEDVDFIGHIGQRLGPMGTLVMLIIVVCVARWLYTRVWRRVCPCARPKSSGLPFVAIKIFYGWRAIVLPLIPIYHDINVVKVTKKAPALYIIAFRHLFTRQITLNWQKEPFVIQVADEDTPLDLPKEITVPWAQLLVIKMALRAINPTVRLVLVSSDKVSEICQRTGITDTTTSLTPLISKA